ncbi:hypothetical protein BLOT_002916 [Blomia tropicalis]|nr:hypothetical protein BLOT_002916 [Blomia tropicalis]
MQTMEGNHEDPNVQQLKEYLKSIIPDFNDMVKIEYHSDHITLDIGRPGENNDPFQEFYDKIKSVKDRYNAAWQSFVSKVESEKFRSKQQKKIVKKNNASKIGQHSNEIQCEELMSELTITENNDTHKINHDNDKKKGIFQEGCSMKKNATVISEDSTCESKMRTRYRTRLASGKSNSQPIVSSSKSTPIRMATRRNEREDSTCSSKQKINLTNTKIKNQNNSNSSLNTPKRGNNSRVNTSPLLGTPASLALFNRNEIEREKQEKLLLSASKQERALEKKKELIEQRIQRTQADRAKREERIRENKIVLQQKKNKKTKPPETKVTDSVGVKTRSGQANSNRFAEIRRKIEQVNKQNLETKKNEQNVKSQQKRVKKVEQKPTTSVEPINVKHKANETVVTDPRLSPIISNVPPSNNVVNMTFTLESNPTSDVSIVTVPINSTIINPKPNTPINKIIAKTKLNDPTSYQMTPPPKDQTFDNYDISKYIDSEDESEQIKHEEAKVGKPVPKWAASRLFLESLRKQYAKTEDEIHADIERNVKPPVIPIPLEQMGLVVREKYVQRSSSINWKSSSEI